MAAIEGPQAGGAGDLAGLRLEAAMQKLGVPGASIAVIENVAITATHGYGVAVMTNSDSGGRLVAEVRDRVAAAY